MKILGIVTLSIMTLSIRTLSIIILSITIEKIAILSTSFNETPLSFLCRYPECYICACFYCYAGVLYYVSSLCYVSWRPTNKSAYAQSREQSSVRCHDKQQNDTMHDNNRDFLAVSLLSYVLFCSVIYSTIYLQLKHYPLFNIYTSFCTRPRYTRQHGQTLVYNYTFQNSKSAACNMKVLRP